MAWAGRTSTYDQQDPTLSLPRQLRASQYALPDEAVIVAHFYDIESGRKDLAERGHGSAHEQFDIPIPRDGGIADLLAEAERSGRRFDVVICESIDRISRRTHIATEIEHRLDQAGVLLLAADEPIRLRTSGRRKTATALLTRRVKQGVAEWYVTEMLEKSWDGFAVHTEAGFNVGKPCYGYRARHVPHPVPAKRAKGGKKTRLEVDQIQGEVVRTVFQWRVDERVGYQVIADRLNRDLVAHPPPIPVNPDRAIGCWTHSNVREILTNPKHTGHMVWNRRARKGNGKNRVNPVGEWVWSREPTHEALVDIATFIAAQQVAEHRERSRAAAGPNRHPATLRTYRLRGYLTCVACGRRMCGNTKHPHAYYVCVPKKAWRPAGHPAAVRVREDAILEHLTNFLATRVFGRYRHDLLDTTLATLEQTAKHAHSRRIAALRRAITDTDTKITRLLRSLELIDEPDPDLVGDINHRRAELRAHRASLEEQLAETETEVHQVPNPDLLHQLPIGPVDLEVLPEDMARRLFDALRLQISYDHVNRTATCHVTLTGDTVTAVAHAVG
ncbi:MAG TPA: recombinase family protein, partial [Mycobacteriales bacterium]|nr:recombinase family protein [Mycobacteriales bacterium]